MGEVLIQVYLKSIKLLDKQVNAQKENLKNTSGVHASSCKPTKKYAIKMKETKKKMTRVKMLLMVGSTYTKQVKMIGTSFGTMILDTMKAPLI